ncbi:putative mediator of RNA polymerase II transcription subunit 26 [Planococcus citri]|uniref:putative mediator of RNA polymerase II transcription subunit 26 n=1 Tax=Planococcus citri TaxID=170843 RepID=UPI0031F72D93
MRKPSIQQQKWILAAFSLLLCVVQRATAAEEAWSKPESTVSSQDNNGWIPVQGKCLTCRPNRDLDAQTTNEQINKVLSPPAPLSQSSNPPYGSAAPPFGSAAPPFGSASPPFGSAAPPFGSAAPLPQQGPSLPPQQLHQQHQHQQQQQHQQHQIPQQQHHQLQSTPYKQPRILPFGGPNFHQLNLPFGHEHKFQIQPTKLFPQEGQKQFYQFEGNHFQKQPFNLPQQQLIQAPQQRFPFQEPYPFTLPLKTIEATTPKISYNPKIRFPDNDGPSPKPGNKIPPQNVDEIQLLYVPVETLQRQRHVKNMKDLINQQNQQYQQVPQNFAPPAFNVQYQPAAFPKPENNLYFPPSYAPPSNFLQLNALPAQKLPDNVYQNISKNLLQPYFTINGLYSPLPPPQIAPLPTKQSDLQFYNILQPALINPPQVQLKPEPSAVPPPPPPPTPTQINRQPNKYDFNNNFQVQNLQGGFILSNGINDVKPQQPSQSFESYPVTTPDILKTTEYITEKPTVPQTDFNYNYITGSPQTSASQSQNQYVPQQQTAQSQQYYNQQNLIPRNVTKSSFTVPSPAPVPASAPYDESEYPVPHQPPLSFYMEKLHNTKINDVLYLLKDSKTIPVLDTVESEPPQVFVGPTELQPPKGYVKFELPYLSSLDYNRIERMIDRLPFFVAPLNFKPPPGYSKIPFPAPHIGSVVLSNSTVLQESLSKYDQQKYKQSQQSFSSSPELSTITPQLTSQINSLIDAPPPSVASEILKTYEESTKKPIYKNTYRPASSSTEAPKRNLSRQRKPIYRGYPTTETPTTYEAPSTTETPKVAQNNNDYVEFAAKGKFNFNSEPSQNPTYQPNQLVDSYQSPPSPDNTYQPQTADTYQSPQVSSTYQPTQQSQYDTNFTTYASYQNNVVDQTQNENLFTKKIASQVDYNGNQNYPFYNFDLSSSQAPSEPTTQNVTQEAANYNFNNVKPLSQYNHFLKKEDVSPVNITEPAISSTSDASYQFWNQNQFYKNNPNTLDYFSSTVSNHIAEPTPSPTTTTEQPTTSSRFIKATTESSAKPVEPTFTSEQQKLESQSTVESSSTTTATPNHRLRNKQRVPNRYQSKYTTEKHIEEEDLSAKPTYDKAPAQELDSVQQSTENSESSTRVEIKQRRRRPTRPAQIVTAVTEPSSSTSRSFRTRATRYPTAPASSTERYRARRPTTNAATEEYTSNYVPSAPASNEIAHEKKLDLEKDHKPDADNYWSEAVSIHQSQSYEVPPSKASKNFTDEGPTDYLPWTDVAPKNSGNDGSFYQYSTTADSRVSENPENKTQDPTTVESSLNEKPTSDQVSPTFGTVNYSSTDEHVQQDDKQEQDIKSDKFLTKDDNQKKAYSNPQDEKKAPGRRRGTWVKKIRIKQRPQDVFETAESQNLGRITDNSVSLLDSKILPKTDEGKGSIDESHVTFSKIRSTSTTTIDDSYITTTEPTSAEIVTLKPTTTEKDDYQNLQRNFDKMLSDFLNSNDQSVKSVNIERNNTSSAENNIGYILGLDSSHQDTATNNSSSSYTISSSNTNNINNNNKNNNDAVNPTEITDEVTTTTTYPNSGEFSDIGTTTEDNLETFFPNKLIGTSTTTEISLETEICYRGKCVKTKKSKASDLLPVE